MSHLSYESTSLSLCRWKYPFSFTQTKAIITTKITGGEASQANASQANASQAMLSQPKLGSRHHKLKLSFLLTQIHLISLEICLNHLDTFDQKFIFRRKKDLPFIKKCQNAKKLDSFPSQVQSVIPVGVTQPRNSLFPLHDLKNGSCIDWVWAECWLAGWLVVSDFTTKPKKTHRVSG